MTTSPIAASSLTKERAVGKPFELVSRCGVAVSRQARVA
jgi:hypothetical protein